MSRIKMKQSSTGIYHVIQSKTCLYDCTFMTRLKSIHHISLLAFAFFIISFYSCHNNHPIQLVQADSLLLHGNYYQADSLLSIYDKNPSNKKSAQMYRQLLLLFVDEELTDSNFALVDSLTRYYNQSSTPTEYAKSLCFLGEIYRVNGDFPSALDVFLKSEKIARECKNDYVLGWIYNEIGDVYFAQRMFDECTNYYRNYYNIAVNHRDTLRMALGACRMGIVFTIYDKVDSIIPYYQKAIELGNNTIRPENIVPHAIRAICDIYTQIGEYDKAKAIMPRDSLYDYEWAFWHLGQNHTDSAIYYFEKIHTRLGLPAYEESIRYLAQLEEKRGNISKALSYYKVLPTISDSLRAQSRIEETRRINAQYNVNLFKRERDDIALRNRISQTLLIVVIIIAVLTALISVYAWRAYQQKKDLEIIQERLLRKEEEGKRKRSADQIKENNLKITLLKQQLSEAYERNNINAADRIKLDAELLVKENQSIEVRQQRKELVYKEFLKSELYSRLISCDNEKNVHLSETEWNQLAQYLDIIYDHFRGRLLGLAGLSETELRVCCLIKVGVTPTAISILLFKTKTAISMLRRRLYEKITHQKGSSELLDEFIKNF